MFLEQTNQYTITADEYNWILIWHPNGIEYQEKKDGSASTLPKGRRSYFNSLYGLTYHLIDRKARLCENLKDIADRLDGFLSEIRSINRLEKVKETLQ